MAFNIFIGFWPIIVLQKPKVSKTLTILLIDDKKL